MVADKVPDYFNTLVIELKKEYGDNLSYTRLINSSPQKFPHLFMKRLNSPDALPTLSGKAEGMRNSIEVRSYHNKGIVNAEEFAFKIREILTDRKYGIGLECTFFEQVDNASSSTVIQHIARYEALETDKE